MGSEERNGKRRGRMMRRREEGWRECLRESGGGREGDGGEGEGRRE